MKRNDTRRGNRIGVVPAILRVFALTMLTCAAVIGTAAGAEWHVDDDGGADRKIQAAEMAA